MSSAATMERLLGIYLRNHDAGAVGGLRRFAAAARTHSDPAARAELARLHTEIAQDHEQLRRVMEALGVRPSRAQQLLVTVGEQVGRLKPNGKFVGRSRLTDVVEVEALILGVTGKLRLWHVLATLAPGHPGIEVVDLEVLQRRAVDQLDRLARLHVESARELARELARR
jgi:hypothetical protein